MDLGLDDKIAVVTGGSSGIGLATVEQLLGEGAKVAFCGRNTDRLDVAKRDLESRHDAARIFSAPCDVLDPVQVDRFRDGVVEQFGAADILINNAGITRDNILIRMKQEEWDEIIDTNLTSVFKMSKAVLRGMMKKKAGRIISITSVVGAMGNSGQVNYASAKAGIMGFTKSLAREVGSRGITVNAVAPGFIQTDMTEALLQEQKETLTSQIPMARLGTVEEIAQTVLFLAGDGGSYITAQTLHVNGGMYAV